MCLLLRLSLSRDRWEQASDHQHPGSGSGSSSGSGSDSGWHTRVGVDAGGISAKLMQGLREANSGVEVEKRGRRAYGVETFVPEDPSSKPKMVQGRHEPKRHVLRWTLKMYLTRPSNHWRPRQLTLTPLTRPWRVQVCTCGQGHPSRPSSQLSLSKRSKVSRWLPRVVVVVDESSCQGLADHWQSLIRCITLMWYQRNSVWAHGRGVRYDLACGEVCICSSQLAPSNDQSELYQIKHYNDIGHLPISNSRHRCSMHNTLPGHNSHSVINFVTGKQSQTFACF